MAVPSGKHMGGGQVSGQAVHRQCTGLEPAAHRPEMGPYPARCFEERENLGGKYGGKKS